LKVAFDLLLPVLHGAEDVGDLALQARDLDLEALDVLVRGASGCGQCEQKHDGH
jgi:hypothetical protein